MSDEKRDALKKLAQAATPGPWEARLQADGYLTVLHAGGHVIEDPYVLNEEDKAFIAAANPQVVLSLLERLEALEKEREQAQAALSRANKAWAKVVVGRMTIADAREDIDRLARLKWSQEP